MELAYYSDYAVRLVNSEEPARNKDSLTSVEAVRELFGPGSTAARRATDADVTRFRSVRARLRAVFEAADGGDETLAVDLLNSLLLEFPVSPQISGHGHRDDGGTSLLERSRELGGNRPLWHMHLADHPSNATAGYAAIASMGLAFHLTEHGVERLGICEATPCRNAYLDTSTNRSRRYCSDRCATRANVAAYRARKREEADRSHSTGRTADSAQSTARNGERCPSERGLNRPTTRARTSSSGTVP
ncbi:CGNR zinc finger domain-containing protein [Streptomyces sp. LHD-70]|uniref:CGNR zinc finger domain-containing protein n=1 Tax=Streptomyces sp. LHD-70 TaxID=3072140 RepID=UPI00280D758F|nr:CGNR zinc finger domain-containing protein [Streptomyces sp. LHD-70]MDQ8702162.1 CGNR zinc finger domain-containing protein [Streptomyces sp. LHD-70]